MEFLFFVRFAVNDNFFTNIDQDAKVLKNNAKPQSRCDPFFM